MKNKVREFIEKNIDEDLKNKVKDDNDNKYLQKCATEINKWLNTVYGEA